MKLMVVYESTSFINPLTVMPLSLVLKIQRFRMKQYKMFIIRNNTVLLFGPSFHLSPPFSSPQGGSVGEFEHSEYCLSLVESPLFSHLTQQKFEKECCLFFLSFKQLSCYCIFNLQVCSLLFSFW